MMNDTPQGPIQMPQIDYTDLQQPPTVDNDLLMKIDSNIHSGNWIDTHQCITVIRQINKFHSNFIPDVINRYSNALTDLFHNGKTQIIKNLLRLVKQIFDVGKSINVENAVVAFLPIILKKSSNDIGHIKEMSQLVLTSFSDNCGYEVSFSIASQFCCCDKSTIPVVEISIKLLARLIQNIGQGLMQLTPETLQKMMNVLSMLIDGKRKNLQTSSLDIWSENYLSLMNYSLQQNQVQSMGCAMQTHRVNTKSKPTPLATVLKARKTEMIQQKQMGQNMNNNNYQNSGNQNYGNQNYNNGNQGWQQGMR